ncbi:MAG: response regulator [Anaerolineales bacterium]|nr:response regulator [Anaerolineales bacterium]
MDSEHRVLIIDDDPAFVKATEVVLESHGYQVDSARDGDEGLAKMEQWKPDLVLLDVMMNWPLEGVHVSREMMKRKELRDIPIIMVTSIVDTQYRELFLQNEYLHIDSGLLKPCLPSALVAEVKRVLSLSESR